MILETKRLILRKLEDADFERLFLMDSNPEVMEYLETPAKTVEDSKR